MRKTREIFNIFCVLSLRLASECLPGEKLFVTDKTKLNPDQHINGQSDRETKTQSDSSYLLDSD